MMSTPAAANSEATRILDEPAFKRLLRRATLTLLVALGAPGLALLAMVGFMHKSATWVDHTDQVIAAATMADKILLAMQTGFRGYRLSNNEQLLKPYREGRADIGPKIDELAALVEDSPEQIAEIRQFRVDLAAWLQFIDEQFAAIRTGQTQVTNPAFLSRSGPLFDRAEDNLEKLINAQEQLRRARVNTLVRVVTGVVILFSAAALLGVPCLVFGLQRLLRKTARTYGASLAEAVHRAGELQVTLQSIRDAVIATDAQGRVEFLNPAAEKLTGWKTDEARGRDFAEIFEIFNENTRARIENPVEHVLRENIAVGLANHTVLRARNGHELSIEDSAAPIRDATGAVRGAILVFHDVTAKRKEERQLAGSESRLRFLNGISEATRTLAEPAQIMEVTARLLGTHLKVSRCAYAEVATDGEHFTILYDYTDGCASTVGAYELSLFGPRALGLKRGDALVIRNVTQELSAAQGADMFHALGIEAIVCLALVKDRQLRALMAVHQNQPRAWSAGELSLIAEVVERCWATIERARTEQDLRTAKAEAEASAVRVADAAERFRLLAEVVSLQVWTAKLDGGLDFVNQECITYLGGVAEKDILGDRWTQYVHPDDLPIAEKAWGHSLATGEDYEVEFRLRGQTGVYRWFLVRAAAMCDATGQIVKWFGTNTDIDDLKGAQAEAERANHAKDDFIAALSHELRTPLTPVLLTAGSLCEDDRLPADVKEQLAMMERNITLEARLIDDLLDLTTIVRGKLSFRTQACDAHSLVSLACEIVREDALAKAITITRDFSAQHSGLLADPARFQQVVWNLLRNAVKFTPQGGKITVKTSDQRYASGAPWLRIEVSDSGIGIASTELERIFLPFEQGGLTGNHRFGGIGLGLSIARAIVNLHGGRIHAESAGPGLGSTFIVELPRVIAAPEGMIASLPAATPPVKTETANSLEPLVPLRLLLVEDHESTLQSLTLLLTRAGCQVVPTNTVASALAAANNGTFDLVISDLGLPDGTGIELMEQLRDRHDLRGIVLSGYGMEEDIARSHAAGFVAHLIKPIDFTQLMSTLKSFA
jgi:PAS domain S-box-containing protein